MVGNALEKEDDSGTGALPEEHEQGSPQRREHEARRRGGHESGGRVGGGRIGEGPADKIGGEEEL